MLTREGETESENNNNIMRLQETAAEKGKKKLTKDNCPASSSSAFPHASSRLPPSSSLSTSGKHNDRHNSHRNSHGIREGETLSESECLSVACDFAEEEERGYQILFSL